MRKAERDVVVITGASSGIGEGLALALAKKGATLGLLARREELLLALAERCNIAGGVARVFAADVTDADSVKTAANALREEFGFIDVMIANAGVNGKDEAVRTHVPSAVAKVFEINLMGAINAVHAGAASRPPCASFMIRLGWSKPIHTPATRSVVYPMNHTSVYSLVVPVLPAAGSVKPPLRTRVPEPRVRTSFIMSTMIHASSRPRTWMRSGCAS